MPTPPDGIPWLAWAVVVVVLALIAQVPLLVQQHRTKRDVAEVKDQVKNTHSTNLREDMDENRKIAADARTEASLAKEASHRTERLAEDLLKTLRAVEHSLDRRDKLHLEAMDELREDQQRTGADLVAHVDAVPATVEQALAQVPPMIADAIAQHAAECPPRQTSAHRRPQTKRQEMP